MTLQSDPASSHGLGEIGAVRAWAPSRLHWGLLNETGAEGWIDGGAGHGLAHPSWDFTLSFATGRMKQTPGGAQSVADEALRTLAHAWEGPIATVNFAQGVGFHQGLGAKTSLLLALGKSYAHLLGIERQTAEIAALLRRGGTSGVGVRVSDRAGIVTDRGHPYPAVKDRFGPSSAATHASTAIPGPTFPVPDSWRVILLRMGGVGLYGMAEQDFFLAHCPIPGAETRRIMVQFDYLQEALRRRDILATHEFLSEMQYLGLKRREWDIQSHNARVLRSLWEAKRRVIRNLAPMCLSSMGPTLFLLSDDPRREAEALLDLGFPRDSYFLTRPSASGTVIQTIRVDGVGS